MNINKYNKISPKDRVLMPLDQDDMAKLSDINNQQSIVEQLKSKQSRHTSKFYAMQVMFWDDVMTRNEQAETASSRGKTLGICRDENDKLVFVEKPQLDQQIIGYIDEDDY